MKFFFADDSSQRGVREGMGQVLGFGGVFVDSDVLRELQQSIDAIAVKYNIPKGEELKWSPRRGSWIHENLHGGDRESCYREVLQAAVDANCTAVVVAWDAGRTTLQGERAFGKVLDFAFERITMHLTTKDSLGVIVADRPGGRHAEDAAFLADFLQRVNEGTDYVPPERVPINILTTPSHLQRHLQLADLVTGISCAMVSGNTRYAEPLMPLVREMFCENAYGYKGGTGLKLFPDALTNLYHWVLGEDHLVKVGMNTGFPIPDERWPYHEA